MNIVNIRNWYLWRFRPYSLLMGPRKRLTSQETGWLPIEIISSLSEIKKLAQDDKYLGGAGNDFLSPLLNKRSVFRSDGKEHALAKQTIIAMWKNVDWQNTEQNAVILFNNWMNDNKDTLIADAGRQCRYIAHTIVLKALFGDQFPQSEKERNFRLLESLTGLEANIFAYHTNLKGPVLSLADGIARKKIKSFYYSCKKLVIHRGSKIVLPELPSEKSTGTCRFSRFQTIISMLVAGTDTTGSALSWLFYWYGKEGHKYFSAEINEAHDLNREKLEAFVSEVLRISPPIDILPRKNPGCADSFPVQCPSPIAFGHSNYFNLPETFLPDRWIGDKEKFSLAFGIGKHHCAGQKLAKLILISALESLVINRISIRNIKPIAFEPRRRNVSLWPSLKQRILLNEVSKI